jgi:protease I
MVADISNCRIAVLATDGVEQVELTGPVKALREAGATVTVIAMSGRKIQGFNHQDKGDVLSADAELADVRSEGFDALVLPGGVANPDTLRTNQQAVQFVRDFVNADKPIAAICHGPWTLIEAEGVRGKRVTSWPSLRTDLTNAGAVWSDEACVVDGTLVTSRKPDDLPAFNQHFITVLQKRAA